MRFSDAEFLKSRPTSVSLQKYLYFETSAYKLKNLFSFSLI